MRKTAKTKENPGSFRNPRFASPLAGQSRSARFAPGKHSASGNSRNTYSVVKHHGRQTPTRCADGHADSRLDSGTKPGGPDHKSLRTLRKLSGPIPASLIKSSSLQFATGSRLPSFITAAASTKLTADIRRTVAFSIATAHRSASGSSRRIAMADVSMINEEGRPLHKEDRLGRLIGRVAANAQRSPSRVRGADPTACPFRHGGHDQGVRQPRG